MKLSLPSVTLICADCVNPKGAIKVIEKCKTMCDFGDVKLFSSHDIDYEHAIKIDPLNSLIAYSIFMLTRVHRYVNTKHLLTVQCDGWILNTESWDERWLQLDYIGPLFVQMDRVGSGGFSLRSKAIMEYMASIIPKWDGTEADAQRIQSGLNYYEDGVISLSVHARKFRIATDEQGARFGQGGNRNPAYFRERPFGFHRTWQSIDFEKGIVDSSDLSRHLQSSYQHEIDKL